MSDNFPLGMDDPGDDDREPCAFCHQMLDERKELVALRARLAPTASDEQRAREIVDAWMTAGETRSAGLLAPIAQALGAARQQGAEGERERCAKVAEGYQPQRENQHVASGEVWVECFVHQRIAAAIRART